MSRDIPIIFSGPMVRALLNGRKTMTRRLAWRPTKPTPGFPEGTMRATSWQSAKPGDRLWVRETFSGDHCWQDIPPSSWGWDTMQRPTTFWYWAAGNPSDGDWTRPIPSIHMPRWASRLTLVVSETKIEPIQAISADDAEAEGIDIFGPDVAVYRDKADTLPEARRRYDAFRVKQFRDLWQSIHGDDAWSSNPAVVALSFRVYRKNIDAMESRAAA